MFNEHKTTLTSLGFLILEVLYAVEDVHSKVLCFRQTALNIEQRIICKDSKNTGHLAIGHPQLKGIRKQRCGNIIMYLFNKLFGTKTGAEFNIVKSKSYSWDPHCGK